MTGEHLTEIPIVFYRTSGGVEPVRDWLRVLPGDDKQKIGFDLAALQVGWPVGMPLAARLGAGYGKCAAACRAAVSPEYCFACTKDGLALCTALSRRHRKRRGMRLNRRVSG